MGLKCFLFGHKHTRLKGCTSPLMKIETTVSGLVIEIDYCSVCGVLHGRHRPKSIHIVTEVEELKHG